MTWWSHHISFLNRAKNSPSFFIYQKRRCMHAQQSYSLIKTTTTTTTTVSRPPITRKYYPPPPPPPPGSSYAMPIKDLHTNSGWASRYWANSVLNSISKYCFNRFLIFSWWQRALNMQLPSPSLSMIFNPWHAAFFLRSANKTFLSFLAWSVSWRSCCKLRKACSAEGKK